LHFYTAEVEEEEGCYSRSLEEEEEGCYSRRERCVTGQSSDYVATDPRKEGVEGWKGL
jgi:hypothetical protein